MYTNERSGAVAVEPAQVPWPRTSVSNLPSKYAPPTTTPQSVPNEIALEGHRAPVLEEVAAAPVHSLRHPEVAVVAA